MIKIVKQFAENNNDIYFWTIIDNNMVINNNYRGIKVINIPEGLIKTIDIFEDIFIYKGYTSKNKKYLLLDCPDNQCLVHLNLCNYEYEIIEYESKDIFSGIYLWENDNELIITANTKFYMVDILAKKIQIIKEEDIQNRFYDFYQFYLEIRKNDEVITIHSQTYEYIYITDKWLIYDNYYNKQSARIACPKDLKCHNITFYNGMFLLISEDKVQLINTQDNTEKIFQAKNAQYFIGADFWMYNGQLKLIIMNSNKNEISKCVISIYNVS